MPQTTIGVTVTTPAALSIAELVMTLSDYWGYQPVVGGQPNPQTRVAFVRARVAAFLRESYIAARATAGAEAARAAAAADAGQVTAD